MSNSLKVLLVVFSLLIFSVSSAAQTAENGYELFAKGEFAKAAEVLEKLVEKEEENKKAWLYLGLSYAKSGNKKKAAEAFKKVDTLRAPAQEDGETDIKITRKAPPSYTDDARRNGVQGTVKLAVEFLADGTIGNIVVLRELPFGLSDQAVAAARRIKFTPAAKDGKSITVYRIISYSFTIY